MNCGTKADVRRKPDGWWFSYVDADEEYTQDGPFLLKSDCEKALWVELEELLIETEGVRLS